MRKLVINSEYGGFSLSDEARDLYYQRSGCEIPRLEFWDYDIARDDPWLVSVVEDMGDKANGLCAKLKIVEIPNDVDWIVCEYDGNEWIAEKHRTWS